MFSVLGCVLRAGHVGSSPGPGVTFLYQGRLQPCTRSEGGTKSVVQIYVLLCVSNFLFSRLSAVLLVNSISPSMLHQSQCVPAATGDNVFVILPEVQMQFQHN